MRKGIRNWGKALRWKKIKDKTKLHSWDLLRGYKIHDQKLSLGVQTCLDVENRKVAKGLGSGLWKWCSFFLVIMFESALTSRSHDAVGEVLEAVVQLGGDWAHGAVHHLLHQHLQLLLRQAHVKSFLQVTDGAGAMKAGQLGAWRAITITTRKINYYRRILSC